MFPNEEPRDSFRIPGPSLRARAPPMSHCLRMSWPELARYSATTLSVLLLEHGPTPWDQQVSSAAGRR